MAFNHHHRHMEHAIDMPQAIIKHILKRPKAKQKKYSISRL